MNDEPKKPEVTETKTTKTTLTLDVATPEELIVNLREAVGDYYDSANELQGAWQDKKAGRFWTKAAVLLEGVADKLEKLNK